MSFLSNRQLYLVLTLKKTTLWPLFIDGIQLPQGSSHFEEAVYFLQLSSQKFLVLILSISEGWKAESTFEPPSGFEYWTPGLGIQRLVDGYGKSSQEYPVNAGVPQCSIIGPTLFLLNVNDLPHDLIYNIAIYADNTTFYSKCDQTFDLWQQLELAS